MAIESLLKHLPEGARYYRVPVPEEENALGPWRDAMERLVAPSDNDDVWQRLHEDPACREPIDENTVVEPFREADLPFLFPEGDDGRHVREIVDTNGPALELFDAGIQRNRLQFPEYDSVGGFEQVTDWFPRIRQVARLLRGRAVVAVADGDFDAAARDLLRIIRIGELLCTGDGFVVCYLVGIGIQGIAIASMRKFARITSVPKRVRAELASHVRQSLAEANAFAQCLRYDFRNFDLPYIDGFPDGSDLETLVGVWVEKHTGNTMWEIDLDESERRAKLEARRAKCRRDFLLMLEGHPRPFDKIGTVRLVASKVANEVRLLSRPPRWRRLDLIRLWIGWRSKMRQRWLNVQAAKWPGHYSYGELWSMFVDPPESFRETMRDSMEKTGYDYDEQMRPPTDEELLRARQRLRRVDNPLGLMLASSMGTSLASFAEQQQQRSMRARMELAEQLES